MNSGERERGEVFCFQRLAKAFIGADSKKLKMRRLPPTGFRRNDYNLVLGVQMNPICGTLKLGTLGELLVQLRLLQFDVQAAPPLKDTGNDLIAIRGEAIRAIQIKSTTADRFEFNLDSLPRLYHALALVQLVGDDRDLYLDHCRVFLVPKADVRKGYYTLEELAQFELSVDAVDRLFPNNEAS